MIKIGIAVHGKEVIDSGSAFKVLGQDLADHIIEIAKEGRPDTRY
jgi:hypothetical protein